MTAVVNGNLPRRLGESGLTEADERLRSRLSIAPLDPADGRISGAIRRVSPLDLQPPRDSRGPMFAGRPRQARRLRGLHLRHDRRDEFSEGCCG